MRARRVGLFGGTFDPPHRGHVAALSAAARTGRCDRIEVVVAGDPYHKGPGVAPAELRLAMARAAFEGLALVEVSDREIVRQGPSYTVDTVRELLVESDAVDLVVGADLAQQLDSWHEADALRELVEVGVVPRPGAAALVPARWRGYLIEMEPVDLSSTFIRELASADRLEDFLPADVIPLYVGSRG